MSEFRLQRAMVATCDRTACYERDMIGLRIFNLEHGRPSSHGQGVFLFRSLQRAHLQPPLAAGQGAFSEASRARTRSGELEEEVNGLRRQLRIFQQRLEDVRKEGIPEIQGGY